jgi:hypothetical protein
MSIDDNITTEDADDDHTLTTAIALCDWCGGEKKWCSSCDMYTRTCCEEYGTCMCS